MRGALVCTIFTSCVLAPALAGAQMVSSEENRARRGCISEAQRQDWDVRAVSGFRARTGGLYDVQLEVGRSNQRSRLTCAWDGRRARLDVTDDPWAADERGVGRSGNGEWQRDDGTGWRGGDEAGSAVDACELALLDDVRREARRRGFDTAEAHVEETEPASSARRDEELIRGTGSYRFGRDRYQRMTFECRVDARTRRVLEARWGAEGRPLPPGATGGPDEQDRTDRAQDPADRAQRRSEDRTARLTCAANGNEERTCPAPISGDVRLVRRDEGRCTENRDWWWGPRGITVRNGCAGEFEYDVAR